MSDTPMTREPERCWAQVWLNGEPSHRCTRAARQLVLTKYDERIPVCWQHASVWHPYGLWLDVSRNYGQWLDVSQIKGTARMVTDD